MRWILLVLVTIGVTVPLDRVGVPSAALFAALLVGIVLAIARLAPAGVPRRAGLAAQGVLGVYIGTMVHSDALSALIRGWVEDAAWPNAASFPASEMTGSDSAGGSVQHPDDEPARLQ